MNKNFFIVCILFVSMTVCGQSIVKDEVNSGGIREILGSLENVRDFKDKYVFNVGLSAKKASSLEPIYFIAINVNSNTPYQIEKGMLLILKKSEDQVITLKCSTGADARIGDIQNVNGYVYTTYSDVAKYEISESELLQLIKGVKKIRAEHKGGTFDKDFKSDKIGEVLKKECILIKSALKQEKSIYDGF